MAKKAKAAGQGKLAATVKTTRLQYHCRCYALDGEYEMWILDPASGMYNGPVPCTQQQCLNCNMSKAEVVGG
jgi:hypothetical protein